MEPYTDGRLDTAYSGTGYSDYVRRPVFVDAEGRKNPIFVFVPSHNTGGYVLKVERIVEHISHGAPVVRLVSDYGNVTEPIGDGSGYDHPKVDNYLTKVQNDVSRPATTPSPPFSSNWRSRPNYIDKPGSGTANSDHIRKKPSEACPQTNKGTTPHDKNMYDERPRENKKYVLKSQSGQQSRIIDSNEAVIKYKGTKVPERNSTSIN